jgi:hypothetical protein
LSYERGRAPKIGSRSWAQFHNIGSRRSSRSAVDHWVSANTSNKPGVVALLRQEAPAVAAAVAKCSGIREGLKRHLIAKLYHHDNGGSVGGISK